MILLGVKRIVRTDGRSIFESGAFLVPEHPITWAATSSTRASGNTSPSSMVVGGILAKHSSTFSNLLVEILLPLPRPPPAWLPALLSNTIMQISREVTHIDGVISEQIPHPGLLIFSGDAMM